MRTRKHSSLVSFVAGASFLLLATTDTMAGSRNADPLFETAKRQAYISLLEQLVARYDERSHIESRNAVQKELQRFKAEGILTERQVVAAPQNLKRAQERYLELSARKQDSRPPEPEVDAEPPSLRPLLDENVTISGCWKTDCILGRKAISSTRGGLEMGVAMPLYLFREVPPVEYKPDPGKEFLVVKLRVTEHAEIELLASDMHVMDSAGMEYALWGVGMLGLDNFILLPNIKFLRAVWTADQKESATVGRKQPGGPVEIGFGNEDAACTFVFQVPTDSKALTVTIAGETRRVDEIKEPVYADRKVASRLIEKALEAEAHFDSLHSISIHKAFPHANRVASDLVQHGVPKQKIEWFGDDSNKPKEWTIQLGATIGVENLRKILGCCLKHVDSISRVSMMTRPSRWEHLPLTGRAPSPHMDERLKVYIGGLDVPEVRGTSRGEQIRLLMEDLTAAEFISLLPAREQR